MNAYEFARAEATRVVEAAYHKAVAAGQLPEGDIPPVAVETPKDASNGDWASTFAMQCAKPLRMAPRKIAEAIVDNLDLADSCFDTVDIAGPGFMNFTLNQDWYEKAVRNVFEMGENYGRTQTRTPEKVMVEFVSANPTGPMHMGNARGGVLGDCLSSVLDWSGNDVTREFYINDAGNQVDKFAHSVEGRYIQQVRGEDAVEFDPSWYQGDDIKALAHDLVEQYGDSLMDKTPEERFAIIEGYGLPTNIARMERDLGRYKINYDVWFRESELHKSGYVKETIDMLTAKGVTYETEDGALWLRTTDFGCDKDDVLRRANGFYTYFAADNQHLGRGPPRPREAPAVRARRAGSGRLAPPRDRAHAAGAHDAGRRGRAHVQAHGQEPDPDRPARRDPGRCGALFLQFARGRDPDGVRP